MIGIVDYGLGNTRAFANVYKRLNIPCIVSSGPKDLERVDGLLLPGVGAFDEAMGLLEQSDLRSVLEEMVINRKIPILGVCVGMQLFAESSEEGTMSGFGWIRGKVKRFGGACASKNGTAPIPHMGWNEAQTTRVNPLFRGLGVRPEFYFLHSFYFECAESESVAAEADYGAGFACAINQGNIFGVQFHPEKSHQNGVTLLKNFGEWCGC